MMGQNAAPVEDNRYSLMNSIRGITTLYSERPCSNTLYCYDWNKTHPQLLGPSQNTPILPDTAHGTTANAPTSCLLREEKTFSFAQRPQEHGSFLWDLVLDAPNYVVRTFRGQLSYLGLFFTANFYKDFSQGSKPQQIKAQDCSSHSGKKWGLPKSTSANTS